MSASSRIGNALIGLAAIVIVAGAATAAQQPSIGPAPGRLIDVGGYKLHIHCVGEGAPTVVIDGGAGAWSIHYAHIQKALSGARVCTYDRAGLGWSDAGPSPRTSERMVEELHALLHGAGVGPTRRRRECSRESLHMWSSRNLSQPVSRRSRRLRQARLTRDASLKPD